MEICSRTRVLIADGGSAELAVMLRPSYSLYFAKTGQAALKIADHNKPDIILLSVTMPDMSGLEVLSKLKKAGSTKEIPVILIGSNDAYAEAKSFELGAADFIPKPLYAPVVKARLESRLKTAQQINADTGEAFVIKTRRGTRSILARELMYVDISGHWLNFHICGYETFVVYASLKAYEDMLLADARFAHCHKSYIVNMDFVESVEVRDVFMKNGDRLPISKRHMVFKKKYVEWLGG